MTDLFWPGDHRAGDLMSTRRSSPRWSGRGGLARRASSRRGIAPAAAATDLSRCVRRATHESRRRCRGRRQPGDRAGRAPARPLRDEHAGAWLHRGLTSQDVLDTALVLCLRDALASGRRRSCRAGARHWSSSPNPPRTPDAGSHPDSACAAQHPRREDGQLVVGVLDAAGPLRPAVSQLPVQVGGAAGTLAATTELAGSPTRLWRCAKRWPRSWDSGAGDAVAHHARSDHPRQAMRWLSAAIPGATSLTTRDG